MNKSPENWSIEDLTDAVLAELDVRSLVRAAVAETFRQVEGKTLEGGSVTIEKFGRFQLKVPAPRPYMNFKSMTMQEVQPKPRPVFKYRRGG